MVVAGTGAAALPGAGWWTFYQIQNVGSTTGELTMTAYDSLSTDTYTSNSFSFDPGEALAYNPGLDPNYPTGDRIGFTTELPSGFQGSVAISSSVEIFAIAQMTPGPIAINAATFTGFRLAGVTGAAIATIAVILPSILIYTLLMPVINRFAENSCFCRLRNSMQLGVLSLIYFAVWSYGSAVIKGFLELGIALVSFLLLVKFEKKLHPITVILTCGVIGLIIF